MHLIVLYIIYLCRVRYNIRNNLLKKLKLKFDLKNSIVVIFLSTFMLKKFKHGIVIAHFQIYRKKKNRK